MTRIRPFEGGNVSHVTQMKPKLITQGTEIQVLSDPLEKMTKVLQIACFIAYFVHETDKSIGLIRFPQDFARELGPSANFEVKNRSQK